jgi:hypothetical protein
MRCLASLRLLSVCAVTSFVFVACDGATQSDLFLSPGATLLDGGPFPTGDDTSNPGHDSGAPSNPNHDSGPSPTPDASPSGDDDGNADSAPPPASATIDCNVSSSVQTCDAASSVCCRTTNNAGNTTFACTPPSGCAQQDALPIPCDSADDCAAEGYPAGSVCCVTEDPNSGVATSVACTSQSDCTEQTQTWLCNETNACPAGDSCDTSTTTIPGYKICRK